MNRVIIMLIVFVFAFSCKTDNEQIAKDLLDNKEELNEILNYIENKYSNKIKYGSGYHNRIVFTSENDLGFTSKDFILNDFALVEKMNNVNVSEIRFEKSNDNCEPYKNRLNTVFFKRNKKWFNSTAYYIYEYCGSKNDYKSKTIYYKSIDNKWGIYIDSNIP